MKRPSLLIAVVCLLAVPAAAADLPRLQGQGTLRVVVWSANLPELYAARGGPDAGMEAEILQGFATLHRLRLQLVKVDSIDARIPALLEDRGDLVAGGLVDTAARRKLVDFSSELFPI